MLLKRSCASYTYYTCNEAKYVLNTGKYKRSTETNTSHNKVLNLASGLFNNHNVLNCKVPFIHVLTKPTRFFLIIKLSGITGVGYAAHLSSLLQYIFIIHPTGI